MVTILSLKCLIIPLRACLQPGKQVFLLAIMLLMTNTAAGQVGIFFDDMRRPVGARALGLAGAYTAMADDATAVYWNPGALGMLNKASLSVGGVGNTNWAELDGTNFDTYSSSTIEGPFRVNFNHASLAIPLKFGNMHITPAFSYHQRGNYQGFVENWNITYSNNIASADQLFEFDYRGGMSDMAFGLGVRYGDHLGLGITYNQIRGSRTAIFKNTFDGSVQENSESKVDFSGSSFVFGLKYSSVSFDKITAEPFKSYEDGVDFGFTFELPHQYNRTYSGDIANSGILTSYTNQPWRLRTGVAFRLDEAMWSIDMSYAPFNRTNTVYAGQNTNIPMSDESVDLFTIATGLELNNFFRMGLMGRNYQYKMADYEQPWTLGITLGVTIGESEYFLWDISTMFEFFNWEEALVGDTSGSIDYKGTAFMLMSSFRIFIPYD
jgi:hypothetical protein